MKKSYVLFASALLLALVGCRTRWVNSETGVAIEYEKKDGYIAIGRENYEWNEEEFAVDKEYRGAIEIPETIEGLPVKVINSHAFRNSKISSVTIPNSVTTIGRDTFYSCRSLTSITIPDSVTTIWRDAFSGCRSLNEVHITDLAKWCAISFGSYDENPCYYAHHLYLNGEEIKDLVIPDSVTTIGKYAFSHCSSLTSVTIPDSVTTIGEYAFSDCSSLTSVTIPNSVTTIGRDTFYSCRSLTSITIPDSVTTIGEYAFSDCSSLTSVTIPGSVTEIGRCVFFGCSSLTSITIPNSVTEIGRCAFFGCSSLTSITIPNSVTKIEDDAFKGCRSLRSVTIGDSVTTIGARAFYNCSSLTSVTIPNSVTKIGKDAFSDCRSLKCIFVDKGDKNRILSLYNFNSDVTIVEINEWNEKIVTEGLKRLASERDFKVEMIIDQIEAERKRLEEERLAKEEAERKERERLEAERRAKEEAERKERERLEAERRAKEEAERKERERLEAERKARELQEAIDKAYTDIINEYWDNRASDSYNKALKGEYKEFSNFIYIAESDGMALIEAFAEEKMPNAASAYEKAKEQAMELQQILNDEFPSPVDNLSDKYSVYCKLLARLSRARTSYHRAYKELAHYYFQYKFGIITQDELAKIDEKPILIDIIKLDSIPVWPRHKTLEGKESAFVAKFMPESYATYQLLLKDYEELSRVYAEAQAERAKANAFLDKVFEAAHHKGRDLADNINKLTSEYIDLYMQHRLGDKDSEALAKIDHERAEGLKDFAAKLPTRVKEETLDAEKGNRYLVVFSYHMVSIPNRKFRMGKTEVTQRQWKTVMGNNPSQFKGDNRPVEMVSWNDAQEFIKRLNDMSKEVGLSVRYRLPTEEEWEYCCRAGSKGDWGKRANGQEGPLDVMGWYDRNSGMQTHPVAQKEPNAWGLYDMHGNVWEWTSTAYGSSRVNRGGSCSINANRCKVGYRDWDGPDYRYYSLGFRLVAEDL